MLGNSHTSGRQTAPSPIGRRALRPAPFATGAGAGAGALALAAAFVVAATGTAAAEERLVVATTGGTWEQQMREHFFDPFTEATGIEVVTVSGSGSDNIARINAMIANGNVEWDLYQSGEIQASSEHHRAMNEDMTEFCRAYEGDPDLLPGACNAAGVLSAYGTTLLVFNTEAFPGERPETWADFWDLERFPGPRALPDFSDPWRVLAAALLADGVPPDELFPLDVDRAFRKMDEIKSEVGLWWRTGDQSTQGFRNGEYVMGMIWQTRASALLQEDQPLEWSQDQAFLVGDRWALIKGAPNRENALAFLEFFLESTEAQARRCEIATCTPVRRSAAEMMSPEAREAVPTSPEVLANLVIPDADWINANNAMLLERWNTWIQQP